MIAASRQRLRAERDRMARPGDVDGERVGASTSGRHRPRPDEVDAVERRAVGAVRPRSRAERLETPDGERYAGRVAPCGDQRPLRERDRHVAGQEADQRRKQHEARIVLDGQAGQDAEHEDSPGGSKVAPLSRRTLKNE